MRNKLLVALVGPFLSVVGCEMGPEHLPALRANRDAALRQAKMLDEMIFGIEKKFGIAHEGRMIAPAARPEAERSAASKLAPYEGWQVRGGLAAGKLKNLRDKTDPSDLDLMRVKIEEAYYAHISDPKRVVQLRAEDGWDLYKVVLFKRASDASPGTEARLRVVPQDRVLVSDEVVRLQEDAEKPLVVSYCYKDNSLIGVRVESVPAGWFPILFEDKPFLYVRTQRGVMVRFDLGDPFDIQATVE